MITGKLILGIVSFLLALTAIMLGFWSYKISLRMSIRMKYRNYYKSDREQIIQREINQRFGNTVMHFIMVAVLLGALAYLVILLIKNNVPLF